jgi:hypothetical protein
MLDDFSVSATALRESGQGNVTSLNPFGMLLIGIWGTIRKLHTEKLHDLYFSPVVLG